MSKTPRTGYTARQKEEAQTYAERRRALLEAAPRQSVDERHYDPRLLDAPR